MKIRDLFAGAGAEPPRRTPIMVDVIVSGGGGGGYAQHIPTIRAATARERLTEARHRYISVMARVHPTPTYDAVAADLGFDPHMVF